MFSNIFRLHPVKQTGFLWVDLDAYCVKPFDFNLPNIFAPFGSNFINRVLCLEDNSPSLKAMIEFVQTPTRHNLGEEQDCTAAMHNVLRPARDGE